ncbi:putative RNA-binding protein YlmH isoform X3 [Juglans regia]|uniref:RNA-binding protein YlmH isoform X3 n=1 Tax=Juglans regia TaxID=51240 RepID=A0A2I4H3D1_JUGRE|nr:putative RNA-binding protein YlmH isoform X3 [Juglans regia]
MAATIGFAAPWVLKKAANGFARSYVPLINSTFSPYKTLRSFPFTSALTFPASGLCHVAQAIRGDDKHAIEEVKHILEMAKRASSRREVLHTNFLTPPVLKESMLTLEKLADIRAVAQGGYPQAERCRISIGHPDVLTSDPDVVAALSVTGNFAFQPCSHGDYLGAILGTGIAREKLGDIILQVGNVSVSCTKIPLISLDYEPPRTQSFKTVEASLRVDALGSAGFKISRSKLVDSISKGEVRVNWSPVSKNNTILRTGDVVSVSGRGRLKVGEIKTTRKGKFEVELIRYL